MYEKLFEKPNVVGAGIGRKTVGGQEIDDLSVVVMVEKKLEAKDLKPKEFVPLEYGGIPTDIIETGEIKALETTGRFRPAPGGVSIGHKHITAGTLGVALYSEYGERVILSNNHVLANSNDAQLGDEILQPGPHDGGRLGIDDIATLDKFVPIRFNQSTSCPFADNTALMANALAKMINSSKRLSVDTEYNLVDAAIALPLRESDVSSEILDIGLIGGVQEPFMGMPVRKRGRTTDLTVGTINIVHATVDVSYGAGKIARFEEQLVAGGMSAGGDSGSLVVHADVPDAVGLLFAGSNTATIFNPIELVMEALGLVFF